MEGFLPVFDIGLKRAARLRRDPHRQRSRITMERALYNRPLIRQEATMDECLRSDIAEKIARAFRQ